MNNSDEEVIIYDSTDSLTISAAMLIFANGVFGVVCNFLVLNNFLKNRKERNSFNLICVFRAYTNLHVLITLFLAIFLPITLIGTSFYNPAIESSLISFGITLYFVNEYGAVVIALNRLFALYFPLSYSKVFGLVPTLCYILLLNFYRIFRIIQELIYYIPLKCFLYYDASQLTWSPTLEDRCIDYNDNSLFYQFGGIFIAIAICNICSLSKICIFYTTETKESRQKIKKNIQLFVQTCFQDSLFLVDILFTFKLA
ncbi:unnamed protein product [Caenorhabditis angaria]|uniref:G-protein coupled receptors family 1 profile domain-containing protein n=1 Tax=Caenorhabditis angaria TaxID=860376 RepID=A0A9P1IZM9_9PELO|nr:unnamed protein product [Caenorhabditis angaria]